VEEGEGGVAEEGGEETERVHSVATSSSSSVYVQKGRLSF
jgi:hypothetical protein